MTTDLAEVVVPGSSEIREAGYTYRHFPSVRLPDGCDPAEVECLLCLTPKDGYPTRLYMASRVSKADVKLNWNSDLYVLGRLWQAYSWQGVPSDQHPMAILDGHLDAFRQCSR